MTDSPLSLVSFSSRGALLQSVEDHMVARQGFAVATLNLDHVVKLRQDETFRQAYHQHSHVVADGNPIVWLRRLMGQPVDLIPGSELVYPLAELAARLNLPVAMLGATEDTLNLAASQLEQTYPGLQVIAKISPAYGFDPEGPQADAALRQLANSGAALCFLALGAPKQEILAARATQLKTPCGFVSIGAGLDFIAGTQTRAPKWVQAIAMEWLWRMATNPKRLSRRYAGCALTLPGLVMSALSANKPT